MVREPGEPAGEATGSTGSASRRRSGIALLGALILAVIIVAVIGGRADDGKASATQIGLVGEDLLALKLQAQDPEKDRYWKAYEDGDSPEGAFMGWMQPGADSLTADVSLGQTIEPGRYFIFLKDRNYKQPIGVKFSLGGGDASVTTDEDDDKDGSGFWSERIPITVTSSTDKLSLTISRTDDDDGKQKLLLRGLYLTSDPSELVLASDRVVALAKPKTLDRSPPRPGNIVENASFETGLGHGWGSRDDRRFSIQSLWDPETGKEGRASLKLPLDPAKTASGPTGAEHVTIVSKPYSVAPNKEHTLSMWLKTDGKPIKAKIGLVNSFGPPAAPKLEGRPQHQLSESVRVGGEWTRVDLTGFLLRYPTADYHISISSKLAAGRNLWVDAISLNEGGPAPAFATRAPLELGLEQTRPSNIYYEDEQVKTRLRAHNSGSRTLKRAVRYEVYDYLNKKVGEGSRQVTVPAQSVRAVDIDLPLQQRGSFRVVMWSQGDDGSQEEVIYGVVPRPRRDGRDPSSLIGIHSNFTDFQYDAMQRLGIKWDRAMSPGGFFRWTTAEPKESEFVWFDTEIRRAKQRDVSVLGTLGFNDEWPEFADDDGKPDLDKWERFVERVVKHYRGDVRAWEVWNEPNYVFEPDFYAQMLKRAAEAIKRADPEASVVAMGGPHKVEYMQDVFAQLREQYPRWPRGRFIDTLSMHMYPARSEQEPTDGGRAAAFRKEILPRYKQPLWNTETGEWDIGFYRTSNAVRQPWGRSLFEVADSAQLAASSPYAIRSVSQTFLETIGNGLSKFFYYDFRVQASPTYAEDHPTMLEYDDTMRPKAIAYAALAHLFDHSEGRGRLKLDDDSTDAYLFDRGGVPLVGLYARDDQPRTITLADLRSDQLKVYDSMGNRISTRDGAIDYGATPVYIEGSDVGLRTLRQAFEAGSVAKRADKLAPSPTIDEAPRGPIDAASVRVRFSATDETSVPSSVEPEAITFSHRLRGKDGQEDWSEWSALSTADFEDLSKGRYDFDLRARDAAGNQSAVVSREIEVR